MQPSRSRPHRPPGPLAPALLALVSCAALAGCGDPNAGDAAATEFEAWAPGRLPEGYAVEQTNGQNDLPYSGSLTVSLVARDHAAPEGVRDLAAAVCAFEPEAAAGVEFTVRHDTITLPMTCPDDATHELDGAERLDAEVELLAALQQIDGLTGFDAESGFGADATAEPGTLDEVASQVTAAVTANRLALPGSITLTVSLPGDVGKRVVRVEFDAVY